MTDLQHPVKDKVAIVTGGGTGIGVATALMLAGRGAKIAVLEFSEDLEASLVEAMYWHPSQTEDPANVWLRSVVQRSCARLHELIPVTAHTVTINAADSR